MKVTLSLLPGLGESFEDAQAAVIIDVLRATTVICTALDAGANEVITCVDVDQAKSIAQSRLTRPLLCGERQCKKISGFDLGNSPAEYTAETVGGRDLVMTTTNGTRAIAAAEKVPEIFAASFLNLSALVHRLARYHRVQLICAGTDGQLTGEDVLLAGAILQRLLAMQEVTFADDACQLATHYWEAIKNLPLAEAFSSTLGGRNLACAGYLTDLQLCANIDVTTIVPRCIAGGQAIFSAI